jgi:hypothetical protein
MNQVCVNVFRNYNVTKQENVRGFGVTCVKITKMNDEKIGLSVNPKHKTMKQNMNIKIKIKNTKCARPKYKYNFYHDKYENNKIRLWNKIIF